MRFRQHRPDFIDSDEPRREFDFATVDELLADPWVANWKTGPGFHRYSIADPETAPTLMVEQLAGEKWWVLGFIKQPDAAELAKLPVWKPPESSSDRTM